MTLKIRLKELPEQERPRERFLKLGAAALATVELLAVIIGSGTRGKSVLMLAQEVLSRFGSLSKIAEAPIEELSQMRGLGQARAIQLKAALTLAVRLEKEKIPIRYCIQKPLDAFEWVKDTFKYEKREIFGVILQDVKGNALRWEIISIGTLTQTLVHPREVFNPAIRYSADHLILVHNHPSGDPTPSPQDLQLTRCLVLAGRSLGIPVHDHLIVAGDQFLSMKEKGFPF